MSRVGSGLQNANMLQRLEQRILPLCGAGGECLFVGSLSMGVRIKAHHGDIPFQSGVFAQPVLEGALGVFVDDLIQRIVGYAARPIGRTNARLIQGASDGASHGGINYELGVTKARPALDEFLDAELAALGLDETKLALVGFSQGTMMALHAGLRRRIAPASIVGYSGMLVGPEHLPEATARGPKGETPRVLLVHGDQDNVIPLEALFQSAEDLAKANLPCEWHLSAGVAHGIDGGGLLHGGLFIAAGFGVKVNRR